MADLSHWDFAETFSGYQAAALILGIEPAESQFEPHRVRVVAERLERDYTRAVSDAHDQYLESTGFPFGPDEGPGPTPPDILPSVTLRELMRRCFHHEEEIPLEAWFEDNYRNAFVEQTFDRATIAAWLAAIGMKSAYLFDRAATPEPERKEPLAAARWPWGNHHTEALGHLEEAARKWWGLYDPSEPDTAPTNATVAEWLVTERGVSQKMADSIASILRADNLRTGPR